MKKLVTVLVIVMLLVASASGVAAKSNGPNANARLTKEFIMPNVQLKTKLSKDWTFSADDPARAYMLNHYTWYTENFMTDMMGMEYLTEFGTGPYKVVETVKFMKVSDDMDAWLMYEAQGIDAKMGYYPSGVPMYVVLQDTVAVYDTATGEMIFSADAPIDVNKGLGQPLF